MTLQINVTHGEAVIIHAGAVISMLHLVPAISCDDNPQVGMLFLAWRNLKQCLAHLWLAYAIPVALSGVRCSSSIVRHLCPP